MSFKFEIGDIVYAKNSHHNCEVTPNRLYVESQIRETCSGGTQLYYVVRSPNGEMCRVPEGLLSYEMPEYHEVEAEKRRAAKWRAFIESDKTECSREESK